MPHLPRSRRLLPALLLGALVVAGMPALVAGSAAPASASSTYLCTGYASCAEAGMPSAGYAARSQQMYWRMYKGHNCTNYIAYRMIQAGMSAERPWSGGSGNAYYWGYAMASITDTAPTVGSVAWWDRGVPGAGSSGHVAYVEKVISDTEIVISEDSWSGDFHWRTIVKDGQGWPTGFIHFVDKAVANTALPVVSGTPQVDQPLTATTGSWKPTADSHRYQWLADGVAISGATSSTFLPGPTQVDKAIAVQVSAARTGYGTGSSVSTATAPVGLGQLAPTEAPTLQGDGMVDEVLTATPGAFAPQPKITAFRWKADGTVIKGATGPQLTLTQALVGTTISVVEVARRDGYAKANAPSPRVVGPVVEGIIEAVAPLTAAGRNRFGSKLTIETGGFTPQDAAVAYQWLRGEVPIDGATAATYQLTGDDVGQDVAVRVTASKDRFRDLVRTFAFGRTTTGSLTGVKAAGRRGAAMVTVAVSAPGVVPKGLVTVTIGKNVAQGRLNDGVVRLLVPDLSPGTRRVVVEYGGTEIIEGSRAATKVVVKR
ncbi:MAG: CHAP domain-containing protein [Nocardioides sp.]